MKDSDPFVDVRVFDNDPGIGWELVEVLKVRQTSWQSSTFYSSKHSAQLTKYYSMPYETLKLVMRRRESEVCSALQEKVDRTYAEITQLKYQAKEAEGEKGKLLIALKEATDKAEQRSVWLTEAQSNMRNTLERFEAIQKDMVKIRTAVGEISFKKMVEAP